MTSKYEIEEITDLELWQQSIENTPQYTMFVSSIYLQAFGGKFKLFFVRKGIEFKAGFCILLSDDEKEITLDDLVIYSGIFFKVDQTQKEVKARSERFEISEEIIKFLTSKYSKIEIALSAQLEDMRPFLWYNYGSSDKKKVFSLDLRYTSYVDIAELKNCQNEEDTSVFKNLETLRQRNIRKARKENSYTVEELHVELFLEYYVELMKTQGEDVPQKKLENMANVIEKICSNNDAVMFATKNSQDKILYLTVFSFDQNRAYYLFGAGNPEAKEIYKGTICFWDAFIKLAQDHDIKEVDMEGINSPQRGWFKLSFGGNIISYYEIRLGE